MTSGMHSIHISFLSFKETELAAPVKCLPLSWTAMVQYPLWTGLSLLITKVQSALVQHLSLPVWKD